MMRKTRTLEDSRIKRYDRLCSNTNELKNKSHDDFEDSEKSIRKKHDTNKAITGQEITRRKEKKEAGGQSTKFSWASSKEVEPYL
mmetsp:Transcript_10011/g.10816  ORF Transcript_10011/g.10816 Transcript_10011/m.10816 type:complete len:85 (-) Transcript_10011:306-560(-)